MSIRPPPFEQLNLLRNPFGDLPLDEWASIASIDADTLLPHLLRPRTALQILAPCGHGKTSHLLGLLHALGPRAHYVRARRSLPESPASRILLLDEADALPIWRRLHVFRHHRPIVIATHRDFSWELRLTGHRTISYRPPPPDETRLLHILDRRIEHARRGPGRIPTVTDQTARTLLIRHGGNLRAMESDLYEHFEDLTRTAERG